MIFIAESGSTKCDAVFIREDKTEVVRLNMMGFNPFFHSSAFISSEISKVLEIGQYGKEVTHVFFYGAGCSSPHLNAIVKKGLSPAFPNAQILVDHDLKSCAYATYNGKPSISCILGTGSNSVLYDGETITEEVPALAYILGDEGSASYLGKKLLSAYLYKQLPTEVYDDFTETYQIGKDEIFENVYGKPNANVYLAGFAPFYSKHKQNPFLWEIVFNGFREFLQTHALCYKNARDMEVNFVGSIAYYFQDILEDAVNHLGLNMGTVIQKPLDGLIDYHFNYILNNKKPINTN